jgi:hypothetical protein
MKNKAQIVPFFSPMHQSPKGPKFQNGFLGVWVCSYINKKIDNFLKYLREGGTMYYF